MGVSKNRGTQKWMVKIMENPIKMDDLGVPLFFKFRSQQKHIDPRWAGPVHFPTNRAGSWKRFPGRWIPVIFHGTHEMGGST